MSALESQNDLAKAAVAGPTTRRRIKESRARRLNSEVDGRSLLRLRACLEELSDLETKDPGNHVGRHLLHRVVEGEHRVVVDLAGDRDLVLGLGQLTLETLEVLRRPKLGIGL